MGNTAALQTRPNLLDEILDFLLGNPNLTQIVEFEPSTALEDCAGYLLQQNQNDLLTPEEAINLQELQHFNHLVSMLKLRAAQRLN